MLYAIFDEKRRREIQLALEKGREIEFRKSKPLPDAAGGIHFFMGQQSMQGYAGKWDFAIDRNPWRGS